VVNEDIPTSGTHPVHQTVVETIEFKINGMREFVVPKSMPNYFCHTPKLTGQIYVRPRPQAWAFTVLTLL
jgi:hypothetical protein